MSAIRRLVTTALTSDALRDGQRAGTGWRDG